MGNATHIVTLFILIMIFKSQWIEIYDASDTSYRHWHTFKINGQIPEASWNITFRYYVTIFCTIDAWEIFLTNESSKYCHILNLRIFQLFFFFKLFLCIHSFSSVISSQILLIFQSSFVLPSFFLFVRKKEAAKRKVKLKKRKKNHNIPTIP